MKWHYNTPYTAQEKERALKLWQQSSIEFVCHRYHCSERSLWRWKSKYDGTTDSLSNCKKGPRGPMPNRQSEKEQRRIRNLIKRNPGIGLNELYGKLRKKGYTRNPATLYRFLRRIGFYNPEKVREPYKPKPYNTPEKLGVKWQMDVKFVPRECVSPSVPGSLRFYQYTMIDEATRQRFIFAYQELSAWNTVDFVRRAIDFFGYKPKIIQTDNGSEFTYTRETKYDRVHSLDRFCQANGIEHKLIRPRTPRHNGKVERSHRSDNERFYKYLRFYSFADLQKQMAAYLRRSNNIPISTLKSRDGKMRWMTPNEKRAELLLLDYGLIE